MPRNLNSLKWASNQPELMEQIPADDAIPECKWQPGETHTALGVHWSLADDCFRVQVQPTSTDGGITLRRVLSTIAKIFNPLGLVSPVTVNVKIFMQSLWLLNLDWDTPLPPPEAGYWTQFLAELPELNRVAAPRWLGLRTGPSTPRAPRFRRRLRTSLRRGGIPTHRRPRRQRQNSAGYCKNESGTLEAEFITQARIVRRRLTNETSSAHLRESGFKWNRLTPMERLHHHARLDSSTSLTLEGPT